jgi:hypothetical protein
VKARPVASDVILVPGGKGGVVLQLQHLTSVALI